MNRRRIWMHATGFVVAVLGVALLSACATPSPGASGSPTTLATRTGSPSAPISSRDVTASQAPTCADGTSLVAIRAAAADTGFPLPVQWADPALGPADDLFFTLSDVAPMIPLVPTGPATLIVGLSYATGGDRFVLTAGAGTLTYDVASGRVSGPLGTGYGKNSKSATPDPISDPSQFEGILTHPDGSGANGQLTGTITHSGRRDFHFVVEMTEICASTHPTGATPEP